MVGMGFEGKRWIQLLFRKRMLMGGYVFLSCICTMEYNSAIKRNEIGSFVETWMDLETRPRAE